VRVEVTEEGSDGAWVLWVVSEPTEYDAGLAPVNDATGITSRADTLTRPDPKDSDVITLPDFEGVGRSMDRVVTVLATAVGVAAGVALIVTIVRSAKKTR